jgi:hypothetical protein
MSDAVISTAPDIAALILACDEGRIMNADLNDIKYRLSRAFDKDCDAIRAIMRPLLYPKGIGDPYPATRTPELIEAQSYMPFGIHGIRAYARRIEKHREKLPVEVVEALDQFLLHWVAVLELLQQAKPLVVKGRRPSTEPRKTDPRTLENTGTCPVCNRNTKLDIHGRMVAHGYKIEWHSQYGNCHGVSQPPVEISDKGLKFYLNLCTNWLQQERNLAERLKEPLVIDPSLTEQEKRKRMNQRESDKRQCAANIRNLEYSIPQIEKAIAEWQPRPLPGIVAGFER